MDASKILGHYTAQGYDMFDAAEALWWYCQDFASGQDDPLYGIQSSIRYTPGLLDRGPTTGESTEIYDDLCENGTP